MPGDPTIYDDRGFEKVIDIALMAEMCKTNAALRGALQDLYDDVTEYVRINNLHNSDGSLATTHALRRARAALDNT